MKKKDGAKKVHKHIHLQLGLAEFNTIMNQRHLEELVLPNECDMVVLDRVEFACGIRWLGRVTRGMEAMQKLSQCYGRPLNDFDLQPLVGRHGKRRTSDLFWFQGPSR